MDSDQWTPDMERIGTGPVTRGTAGLAPHRRSGARYVTVAPLLEVLEDQIEYLVSHTNQACLPGCLECARLEEAKRCLLRPFA